MQNTVKFYNGNTYPALGLGTYKSPPSEVTEAVKCAIDAGYRHIDCAYAYGNEKEAGDAVRAKIDEGVIKREDICITSKLWSTHHRPDIVEGALKKSLNDFGLQYLDLYLMHTPFALKEGDNLFPRDANGAAQFSDVDYVDTWKAMEKLLEKGLVKNIGVSNFNSEQITRLIANCTVKPVTNQVECHPFLGQQKLSKFCADKGITITAYSPFASPGIAKPDDPKPLKDSLIKRIGEKYNKTPAQVILRYQIQRGHLVVPKSVTKSRIEENIKIFDFALNADDMREINSLDSNRRICVIPSTTSHKYFPFNIEF